MLTYYYIGEQHLGCTGGPQKAPLLVQTRHFQLYKVGQFVVLVCTNGRLHFDSGVACEYSYKKLEFICI